jgi:hypothetical protein
MKSEGIDMIYTTLDNMQRPAIVNGWTAELESCKKLIAEIKQEIAEKDERIRRLLSSVQTWEEKAHLAGDALAIACVEMAHMIQKRHKEPDCSLSVFEHITSANKCDYDCPVCLADYFLDRAKADREAEENNKAVRDEQEDTCR